MNRNLATYGLIALVAAGIAGYTWHAWDTGIIPGNPRAPVKENFDKAIAEALKDAPPEHAPCQGTNLYGVRGEENYSNGARNVPGQGIFGLTVVPEFGGEERVRTMDMLGALAKAGYFTQADTTFEDESGTRRNAKRFQMTLNGWYNLGPNQCLQVGPRSFSGVTKTAKLETTDGTTAYEVTYEMKVRDLPAWAKVENADAIFRQLKSLSAAIERKAKLVRTKSGWDVRFAKPPAPGAGPDSASAPTVYLDSAPAAKAPKLPTLEEASRLFAAGIYGNPSANLACLMLPSNQLLADEVGDVSNADRTRSYYAIYYDDPGKNPAAIPQRADGLALMRALQSIGMVEEEAASDTLMNGQRFAGGAVFRLKQQYKVLLDPRTPGCLPIATLVPEVKAMRWGNVATNPSGETTYFVELIGVAKAKDVRPWVTETGADKKIPLVKWILEEGLPLSGSMRHTPKDGWTGVYGNAARPIYASQEKPAALFAALPRFSSSGSAKAAGAPTVGISSEGDEAHAIVVYEGRREGAPRAGEASREGVIVVTVGRTPAPVELFLSSYEPVLWRLFLEPGARLKRVVAVGYYPQRVVGAPPGVMVEGNHPPYARTAMTYLQYKDAQLIASRVRQMTRASVRSVQNVYTGSQFSVGQVLRPGFQSPVSESRSIAIPLGAAPIPVPRPVPAPTGNLSTIRCGNSTIVCGPGSDVYLCNGQAIRCR